MEVAKSMSGVCGCRSLWVLCVCVCVCGGGGYVNFCVVLGCVCVWEGGVCEKYYCEWLWLPVWV